MKTLTTCVRCAGLIVALVAPRTADAQDRTLGPNAMLQAAVHQETVNGNLDSAITLYRRIASDKRAERSTVAKALLGLGRTHETMGHAEARRAYERIVNEFGDQQEQAAQARSRLSAIAQTDAKATLAAESALSLRRVWHDPGVDMEGQPTPDGRLLTFVDWESGHLAVRDMATGAQRNISNEGYPGYALGSSVSRDGKLAAYFWTPGERTNWQPQLRVVGLDGKGQRILIENADRDINYLTPYEWMPDGSSILVVLQRLSGIELALVNSRTGAIRRIKSMDWRNPMRAALSPDGRWIAYDVPPSRDQDSRDIYLLATDGSAEHRLTDHPAIDLHAVWLRDNEIAFSSRRGGSPGLWRVSVRDGQPQGEPQLIKSDMTPGFYPMGVTSHGTLFYTQDTGGGDIFTVAFDAARGRVSGEARKFVQRYQGLNSAGHVSATGNVMVYTSRRDAVSFGHTVRLYAQDLSSGEERPLNAYSTRPQAQPRVSPDGQQAVVWTRTIRGGEQLVVVDLATLMRTTIPNESQALLSNPTWSRDGKSIFYFRNDVADSALRGPRIVRRTIATGEEETVHRFDLTGPRWHWEISPDETRIAYSGRGRGSNVDELRVAPLGGASVLLTSLTEPRAVSDRGGITWTPDGRTILYAVVADTRWVGDPNVTLHAIDAAGGTPREAGLRMHELRFLSFLPDGKTLMFTAGPNVFNEVWTMENLRAAVLR